MEGLFNSPPPINTGELKDTAGLLRDDCAPLMHMIAESTVFVQSNRSIQLDVR